MIPLTDSQAWGRGCVPHGDESGPAPGEPSTLADVRHMETSFPRDTVCPCPTHKQHSSDGPMSQSRAGAPRAKGTSLSQAQRDPVMERPWGPGPTPGSGWGAVKPKAPGRF